MGMILNFNTDELTTKDKQALGIFADSPTNKKAQVSDSVDLGTLRMSAVEVESMIDRNTELERAVNLIKNSTYQLLVHNHEDQEVHRFMITIFGENAMVKDEWGKKNEETLPESEKPAITTPSAETNQTASTTQQGAGQDATSNTGQAAASSGQDGQIIAQRMAFYKDLTTGEVIKVAKGEDTSPYVNNKDKYAKTNREDFNKYKETAGNAKTQAAVDKIATHGEAEKTETTTTGGGLDLAALANSETKAEPESAGVQFGLTNQSIAVTNVPELAQLIQKFFADISKDVTVDGKELTTKFINEALSAVKTMNTEFEAYNYFNQNLLNEPMELLF